MAFISPVSHVRGTFPQVQEENVGWEISAEGWIASLGTDGDWLRKWVLDPVMLDLVGSAPTVLDVGCGEGRFGRMLERGGAHVVGLDPTISLLRAARRQLDGAQLVRGLAEHLPFQSNAFHAVVSYVTLVDIVGYRTAIAEMARVVRPFGKLIVATITPFMTTTAGWIRDEAGERLHFPVDHYLLESTQLLEWKGIRIHNYHRPLSAYMDAFLSAGLVLRHYLEPRPVPGTPNDDAAIYERAPYGTVMVWEKSCE